MATQGTKRPAVDNDLPTPAPKPPAQATDVPEGGYALGQGSEPNPADPTHDNPLSHLEGK